MDRDRIIYLWERYLENTITVLEHQEWKKNILDNPECLTFIRELMDADWYRMKAAEEITLKGNRSEEIFEWITNQSKQQIFTKTVWLRIVATAAIILVITGGYFFKFKNISRTGSNALARQEIKPGKVGATLRLANGKQIRLTNALHGALAEEAGVRITKSAGGQLVYEFEDRKTENKKMNTLNTDRGETFEVRLPDGSLVWLNAASSLTYRVALTVKGERRVKLDGEAYFEVAKDKQHPFVVESSGQRITVLGTHFNINSYPDEVDTRTTLLEGSVQVNGLTLKPHQQSVLTHGTNRLEVKEIDPSLVIAWKEGKFKCKREHLESLLRKVGRWYDVDIVYENEAAKQQTFSGTLNKADHFEEVLKHIALTGEVNFKIEGRKVIVTK
ncbi:FecR family protein [Pedobacter nutrimenti]|uniref:FecR family protein n=1 Tax=Pedobacter nutrimenti TaxID=1241337 RepID=UPI00292D46F4|nr:FecR domain-containing protein [Pedobacter nutrimenti]